MYTHYANHWKGETGSRTSLRIHVTNSSFFKLCHPDPVCCVTTWILRITQTIHCQAQKHTGTETTQGALADAFYGKSKLV